MKRLYFFGIIFLLEIFYAIFVCVFTHAFLFVPFLIFAISFVALWVLFLIYRNFKALGKTISCLIVILITCVTGFIFTVNEKASDNMFSRVTNPIGEKENLLNDSYTKVKKGKYSGWLYAPYDLENSKMIVYFGDEYEASETAIRHSKRLEKNDIKANLLCFNYPGYGTSKQVQTETSFYDMAVVSVDYARKELKVPEENIIVLGYGFGTANAIYAAGNRTVGQLVLMSPFVEYRNIATKDMLSVETPFVLPIFGTGINSYFVEAETTFITSTSDVYYSEEKITRLKDRYQDYKSFDFDDISHYEFWSNEDVLNCLKEIVNKTIIFGD